MTILYKNSLNRNESYGDSVVANIEYPCDPNPDMPDMEGSPSVMAVSFS